MRSSLPPASSSEYGEDLGEVAQVAAQLGEADQVELAEDLGDVVDRGVAARFLAELADVPGREIERLVELRRRDLGLVDPRSENLQALRDFRGDVAMIHGAPPCG
jgi:hypothetical protein